MMKMFQFKSTITFLYFFLQKKTIKKDWEKYLAKMKLTSSLLWSQYIFKKDTALTNRNSADIQNRHFISRWGRKKTCLFLANTITHTHTQQCQYFSTVQGPNSSPYDATQRLSHVPKMFIYCEFTLCLGQGKCCPQKFPLLTFKSNAVCKYMTFRWE